MSKQEEKGLVPERRFPEFKDDQEWKVKSFNELFTIGNGRDYKHLSSGDIPVYGSGGYMLSVNDYLHDGESVCIGRKGTINSPIFLTGKFWTVDTLFYTHSFNDCLPRFIYSIFQTIDWLKHNEAGGVPSLSKNNIVRIKVAIPELKEQQKIADTLSSADELITVQTQKLDALRAYKKGLMQQLFPSEGKTLPKRRFPEFQDAGEWEEKRLGDVGKVRMCKRIFKEQTSPRGDIPFYKIGTFGGVPDAYISREIFEHYRNNFPFPKVGAVLISAAGTIGRTVIYKGELAYFQDSNIVWLDNNEKLITDSFLFYLYQLINWAPSVGAIQRLYNENILGAKVKFPSILEQQKIADCLASLDELISNQAKKIEALNTHKKCLMQQIFPSIDEVSE